MMMKRRHGPRELVEEALAAHEAFRRLDVAPDEIFVGVQREGVPTAKPESLPLALFAEVKRHNGFRFTYVCGPVADEAESQRVMELWPIAVREWNRVDADEAMTKEHDRIWRESNIGRHVFELGAAWVAKLMSWKAATDQ